VFSGRTPLATAKLAYGGEPCWSDRYWSCSLGFIPPVTDIDRVSGNEPEPDTIGFFASK
jgi:hypothetical protein